MFTVTKKDKSITLRNIKVKANTLAELDKNLDQHPGDYILVKNNKIVKTNCFKKKYEYQRLVGFAVLEKYLKPKGMDADANDGERILAWVEGSGTGKDIVWKKEKADAPEFTNFFAKHEKSGDGIVSLMVDPSSENLLTVDKHHEKMRMPRQALAVGYYVNHVMKKFNHKPSKKLSSYGIEIKK